MRGVALLLFAGIATFGPGSDAWADSVEFLGLYGQGFDFWSKVQELSSANQTPAQVLQLLDANFDHPEEGIASFELRFSTKVSDSMSELFNRAYFAVGADGLAGGVATNRLLPEIQAYEVYSGHIDAGLRQTPPPGESGWEYRLGTTLGAGQETLIDGSVLELSDPSANDRSSLFYSGLDADFGYRSQVSESVRASYRLSAEPTLFHSDYSNSATSYAIASDQFNFRWREQNEWMMTLDTPFEPDIAFGVESIFGQQPTPLSILPRTWDAVHDVDAWPSAAQLVGLGTRFRISGMNDRLSLTVDGGFYGGYFGASALLHAYCVQLEAGTYGFEQTSGYRIEESRIEFLSLGGRFEL